MAGAIERSRALWNREALDLESDEVLAQILDRGEIAAWRDLYRMARTDGAFTGSSLPCRSHCRTSGWPPWPVFGEAVDVGARA